MKNVIIVEDDVTIQKGLEKIVKSIDSNINIILTGYSQKALDFSNKNDVDLFLLDIQLIDYSGIELAKKLREIPKFKLTPIVFITAIPTKQLHTFKQTHCYDYIVKPFDANEVQKTIKTILDYQFQDEHEESHLRIRQKSHVIAIPQEDIIYIEARNKKLYIYSTHETYELNNVTMTKLHKKLNSYFKRCHKGYIINMNYVYKIDASTFSIYIKDNEIPLPLGRKYKDEIVG